MPTYEIALYVVLGIALAISLVTDVRSRLIYDVVTIPTLLLALVVRVIFVGFHPVELGDMPFATQVMAFLTSYSPDNSPPPYDLLSGAVGMALGALPFLVMHLLNAESFGLGDVKLMGAVGAVVGYPAVFSALVYVALVGGLQGVLVLLWRGSLARVLAGMGRSFARFLRLGDKDKGSDGDEAITLPYGVAIVLGTAWSMVQEVLNRHTVAPAG